MTFRKAPPPKPDRSDEFASYRAPAAKCRMAQTVATMNVPVPKSKPWRSEAYRRAVADLPCAHCWRPAPSQCCHADTQGGKGAHRKVSDELTYPGCADSPGRQGCHSLLASGNISRERRAILESRYVARTQATLAHLLPASKGADK